ncbi:MAG: hypothetical protein AAF411_32095 [Myxococcota bacterium]
MMRVRPNVEAAPPTDVPEEFEFIAFFRALASDADERLQQWSYEIEDGSGVHLRLEVNAPSRKVDVRLSRARVQFAQVQLDDVHAIAIDADAGRLTVRTGSSGDGSALVVRVLPHIRCDWTSLASNR